MALTREPSGKRASTMGEDSSTLRPTLRNDAVDDLQQVAIVAKGRIDPLQDAALFHEDMVLVVDQDIGDLRVPEQRLQGAKAKNLIQQIGLDLLLFIEVQRHPLLADDLLDDARHSLARLAGIDAGQLFQIQFGDQGPVNFRFVLFQAQQFHDLPSVGSGLFFTDPLSEQAEDFLLGFDHGLRAYGLGHLPNLPGNG